MVKWLEVAVCGKNEAQRWSHGTLPLFLISEGSVNLHSQKLLKWNIFKFRLIIVQRTALANH